MKMIQVSGLRPLTRTMLGLLAITLVVVELNLVCGWLPFGNRGLDFTQQKVHQLSVGTKEIITHLDAPVVIRYYASRDTENLPQELKLHMRRVDSLLKEYAQLSGGRIRIHELNPEPDTDAEDSALLDGIIGQKIKGQTTYFGLAVSCLEKMQVIPFLNPKDETMLEYQLSRAISDATEIKKPVLGVMSSLEFADRPAALGVRAAKGWALYQQLKPSYQIVNVPSTVSRIDPEKVKTLLLFHPADLPKTTIYALDQYLLHGGSIVICCDPHSVVGEMLENQRKKSQELMLTQPKSTIASSIPELFQAWGVQLVGKEVIADPIYATKVEEGKSATAILTFSNQAMPQKDNVITKDLSAVTFLLSGAFRFEKKPGIQYESLIKSSEKSGLISAYTASKRVENLADFIKKNESLTTVAHVYGNFSSAFPEGKPKLEESEANASDENEAPLTKSVATGHVFLIADVDGFFDQFAYAKEGEAGPLVPNNGSVPLLFNILDQTIGSKHLIGARSRAAVRRPFSYIQKIESEFDQKVGSNVKALEEKELASMQKIKLLQSQINEKGEVKLTPEQFVELSKLRKEQVDYAKQIRELQKGLRRNKEDLSGRVMLFNLGIMPPLVAVFGITVWIRRRFTARAR